MNLNPFKKKPEREPVLEILIPPMGTRERMEYEVAMRDRQLKAVATAREAFYHAKAMSKEAKRIV